mgnify:FL=1
MASVPEHLVAYFTPRVEIGSLLGRYIRVNNEHLFVTSIPFYVRLARASHR